MQMMENATYIHKELPSLSMPQSSRDELNALCTSLISTKHDVMHEIIEINELVMVSPDSPAIAAGIERISNWFSKEVFSFDTSLSKVRQAVEAGQADVIATMLLMENGVNILTSIPNSFEAVMTSHPCADASEELLVDAEPAQAQVSCRTLDEELEKMSPSERLEFWRNAEANATDPENLADIREARMCYCHSEFMREMFKDEIDSNEIQTD